MILRRVYFKCKKSNKLKDQQLTDLFTRYLERKASPQEVEQLLAYFHMEEESPQLYEIILSQMEQPMSENPLNSLYDGEIYDRVENALNERIDKEATPIIPIWHRSLFRVVASVAAILILVSGYVLLNNSKPEIMKTVYAAYGKQVQLQLPDGSKVWLNSGTTISYPEEFKGGQNPVAEKRRCLFSGST